MVALGGGFGAGPEDGALYNADNDSQDDIQRMDDEAAHYNVDDDEVERVGADDAFRESEVVRATQQSEPESLPGNDDDQTEELFNNELEEKLRSMQTLKM